MNLFRRIGLALGLTNLERQLKGAVKAITATLEHTLEDRNQDGLPDKLQDLSRNVGLAVLALEKIFRGRGRGLEKLTRFKNEFEQVNADFEKDWPLIQPLIEIAVSVLRR